MGVGVAPMTFPAHHCGGRTRRHLSKRRVHGFPDIATPAVPQSVSTNIPGILDSR